MEAALDCSKIIAASSNVDKIAQAVLEAYHIMLFAIEFPNDTEYNATRMKKFMAQFETTQNEK